MTPRYDELRALIFKNRGALLAVPAAVLACFGKPSAFSVSLGLPLALAGELLRCWAVGYSGVTTRDDRVIAPQLVTAGPYGYVRNPLYVGNFLTALGFAIAYTGRNSGLTRTMLLGLSLGTMVGVYATIIPHEEQFLRSQFGEEFERYCERVPPLVPRPASLKTPIIDGAGTWNPSVIREAESTTFATFGAMLGMLALRSLLS